MNVGAIIVGAGAGMRMSAGQPKCMVDIDDVPMLILTAWQFERCMDLDCIVLVVPGDFVAEIDSAIRAWGLKKVCAVVRGGRRRQDSVRAGFEAIAKTLVAVLVHDGARPFVSRTLIRSCVVALKQYPVVVPAVAVSSTLYRVENGSAAPGPDRGNLVLAQTPQGFQSNLLESAFLMSESNTATYTDEATLVNRLHGTPPHIIAGEASNVKITHLEELRFYYIKLQELSTRLKAKSK